MKKKYELGSVVVSIKLANELKNKLDKYVSEHGMTITGLVTVLLNRELKCDDI